MIFFVSFGVFGLGRFPIHHLTLQPALGKYPLPTRYANPQPEATPPSFCISSKKQSPMLPQHFRIDFMLFGRPVYALCCYASADLYIQDRLHTTMDYQELLEVFEIV